LNCSHDDPRCAIPLFYTRIVTYLMSKISAAKIRSRFKQIKIDIEKPETYDDPANLTTIINSIYEICNQVLPRQTVLIPRILYDVLHAINMHLMDTWHTFIDQNLFDTMVKLFSLETIMEDYDFYDVRKIISCIFYEILTLASHISYDDAYQIYNRIANFTGCEYNLKTSSYIICKTDTGDALLALFKNKKRPLSEQEALNVLRYPNILSSLHLHTAIKNYFTFSYNVSYEILKNHTAIVCHYKQQICDVMSVTREFMDALIKYGDIAMLHIYMRNNSSPYTVDDLESACSTLNGEIITKIINDKVLPNERCISSLLQHQSRNPYMVRNIIPIFIQCHYPVPENKMRQLLRITRDVSESDMHGIFKYGTNRIYYADSECDDDESDHQ